MAFFGKLGRQAIVYGLANAFTAAVPLLLLPLYVEWLSPDAYGLFSLFWTSIVLLVPLVSLGASAAVQRRYVDLDPGEFRQYVGTALAINITLGITISTIGIGIGLFDLHISGLSWLWVGIAGTAATAIAAQQILLVLWQTENKLRPYALYQLFCLALYLGLPVVSLVVLKLGLAGAMAATAASYVFAGAGAVFILRKNGYRLTWSRSKDLRHLCKFGAPLLPHLLAGWVIAMFDRFLIAQYWSLAAVGIYSFAFQAAQALNILSTSINQALTPWLYSMLRNKATTQAGLVDRVILAAAGIILVSGVALFFALSFLVPRFAPAYIGALSFIPWITAGLVMNGIYRLLSNYLLYRERTWEIASGTILASVFSITANSLLIPTAGPIAAGWTSVLSFGLLLAWTAWRAAGVRRQVFGLVT